MVLDCSDPARLAEFYRGLLGGEADRPDERWALGDGWATLHTAGGLVLAIQRVADHRPPRWPDLARPQQFPLDLGVPDLDAAQTRAVAAGAKLLDDGAGTGRSWRIFADPAGHPFCLVRHGNGETAAAQSPERSA
ncbi:VOC family protein [Streptomyces sp. NPDC015032]|uniref:VOC family protein n=1 Tax=Streptomyces sp. NPDC015032 TaxID=3364937 RepID=UPI0036F8340C